MADPTLELIQLLGLAPVAYPPISVLAAGNNFNQVVWGRTGNDTILPYEQYGPLNDFFGTYDDGKQQFDILLGDSEFPQLDQAFGQSRTWNDTYILGDWRKSYFIQDSLLSLGLSDIVLLADFETNKDTIELHGSASDYSIFYLSGLSVLAYNQPILPGFDLLKIPNIVAIILSAESTGPLDINAAYFKFIGTNPQPALLPSILQFGSPGVEITDAITVDHFGNIFVAGTTTGYVGPNFFGDNSGFRDAYIRKYSPSGTLIANYQFGSTGSDAIFDLVTDKSGNLYAVGSTTGDLAGETPQASTGVDGWIASFKGDLSGINWIKRVENDALSQQPGEVAGSYSIDLDFQGNLYISGVVDVPTPPGSDFPLSTDNAIAKYTPNGSLLWYKQYGWNGGTDFEEAYNSATDSAGNTFSVGFTTSGWSEDPNWSYNSSSLGTTAGLYDVWVSKTNKDGVSLWIRNLSTPDFEWLWGVDTDSNGNVYIAGTTLGTLPDNVDGNVNAGSYDCFVAKYDTNGTLKWLNQLGSSEDDQPFTLQVSPNNEVVIGGLTRGNLAQSHNAGGFDAFILNLNSDDGSVNWSQQFGTSGDDRCLDLAFGDGSIYAVGYTNGSLGAVNSGSFDTWVAKLKLSTGDILDFNSESELSNTSEIPSPTINPPVGPDIELLQKISLLLSSLENFDIQTIFGLLGLDGTQFNTQTILQLLSNISELPPYGLINLAPTGLDLSAISFDENIPDDSLIAILSSSDTDNSPQTFTYALIPGTGDTDNLAFSISNNKLHVTRSPDFEKKSTYTIRLSTTDQGGLSFERIVQLSVNDLQDTPIYTFNISADTVYEGGILFNSVSTENVAPRTQLYWSFSGNGINSADFSPATVAGTITLGEDGKASFTTNIAFDGIIDPNEVLSINFFSDPARTQQLGPTMLVTIKEPSVGVVTDGPDIITGTGANEIISGAPADSVLRGQGTVDKLTGGGGDDWFSLGDSLGVFYNDGLPTVQGTKDMAWITDFSTGDKIILHGSAGDYQLSSIRYSGFRGIGINAILPGHSISEPIGFVQSATLTSLSLLNPNQFTYI